MFDSNTYYTYTCKYDPLPPGSFWRASATNFSFPLPGHVRSVAVHHKDVVHTRIFGGSRSFARGVAIGSVTMPR